MPIPNWAKKTALGIAIVPGKTSPLQDILNEVCVYAGLWAKEWVLARDMDGKFGGAEGGFDRANKARIVE